MAVRVKINIHIKLVVDFSTAATQLNKPGDCLHKTQWKLPRLDKAIHIYFTELFVFYPGFQLTPNHEGWRSSQSYLFLPSHILTYSRPQPVCCGPLASLCGQALPSNTAKTSPGWDDIFLPSLILTYSPQPEPSASDQQTNKHKSPSRVGKLYLTIQKKT